jgi:hypothetical protein
VGRKNYHYGIAVLAIASAAGIVGICLYRRAKKKRVRSGIVAEAGYETAHDIHFPLKINRPGNFRESYKN